MQIQQLAFAVKDTMSKSFTAPFLHATLEVAFRDLVDTVNREGSTPHDHPADYDLYWIGWYDHSTAMFERLDAPIRVANGEGGPCVDPKARMFQGKNSCTPVEALHERTA